MPLMVVGGWTRRRSVDFRPFFLYAAILFAFSALVSAVHVPGGTFIHSAVALAPFTYVLALEGVAVAVAWIAAPAAGLGRARCHPVLHRRGHRVRRRCAPSPARSSSMPAWEGRRERGLAVASSPRRGRRAPSDRVMSLDAASTKYWTGHGGVVLVNDPLDTIKEVARAYDIRWLVLDKDDSVPAATPVMAGERPDWIGPPMRDGHRRSSRSTRWSRGT